MLWYIYTMEYHSAIKTEWSNAICSNMDGLRHCHIKWNKSERERQTPYAITYMWNLSKTKMSLPMKQKQAHRHRIQICGCQGGEGRGDELGVWD